MIFFPLATSPKSGKELASGKANSGAAAKSGRRGVFSCVSSISAFYGSCAVWKKYFERTYRGCIDAAVAVAAVVVATPVTTTAATTSWILLSRRRRSNVQDRLYRTQVKHEGTPRILDVMEIIVICSSSSSSSSSSSDDSSGSSGISPLSVSEWQDERKSHCASSSNPQSDPRELG
ncbi:hypothetical protein HZH66_011318 [Vespula vulgaris]|uniref:Uncharacterized protein n=1 Tax=Vespula vulgaris TaxID=7454 RepID=A0A834JK20_VESVU|nr:hypothetical protein HZH66_011318 [Vespula vulgaris]